MFFALWAVLTAGSTTVLAANGAELWKMSPPFLWGSIGILGAQAAAPLLRAGWRKLKRDVNDQFHRNALTTISQCWSELQALGLEMRDTGVSVFLCQRRWSKPWQLALIRVDKITIPGAPGPSRIEWTKGKGVIGRCWEEENPVLRETRLTYAAYLDCDASEWDSAPADVRMGMSFEEFRRIRRKYSAVAAVPIATEVGGRVQFRGCLAVDVKWDGVVDPLFTPRALDAMRDAAATIANELSYVPAWALIE